MASSRKKKLPLGARLANETVRPTTIVSFEKLYGRATSWPELRGGYDDERRCSFQRRPFHCLLSDAYEDEIRRASHCLLWDPAGQNCEEVS